MKHTSIRKPLSILLSILMVLSVFGGMTFSASAAAVTPKYKIVITSPSGKTATLVASTALPYERTLDSFLTFVGAKKGTHYTSVYSVKHKSGSKITTLSTSKIVVNTYGEETINIILNAVGGGRSQADYKFTVTALTKCVATATGYTGTYDGEAHTIAGVTPTSPESGAAVKYGTVSGTYNLADPPAFTDVGTHPVYYQVSAGGWVNLTGSVNVVINPKTVTVTADAKSKIRGESDPALTYTAEGLLGEDTVTGELTRAEGEAIGTYAIQQGTLAVGSNYAIAYTGANLTIEPNADDLAAANVDALINAIGEVAYTDECKAKIDEARAAYDALTDVQKALVTNASVLTEAESAYAAAANQAAADAVIAKINAIGEVAYTDECKTKIDEAKAAYDALTDAQKALVGNYETLQLAEGQYVALQLAADMTAFEAYKTAKKADMDALLQEGDSEAVQSIVGLAKTQIEGFTYDESKTLDENKAALDTLVANVPNAVAEKRAADRLAADKAAFEAYKAEQKAAVEAMAEEGDSTDAQQIIADAAAAIDALTYDEAKTLDENKAAVDALADVADALAAQRAADMLAADKAAFDAYKFNLVAAVQAMAQDGDSEAAAQIIADAAAAIALLDYDTAKTLDENKAAVDAQADIADALAAQRAADAAAAQLAADKAAFEAYKAEQKAAVEAMAEEGDSTDAQQIIADAAAAIDALTYDEAKTLDENKAAVDAAAEIADALAEQRAAEAAAAALAEAKEAAKTAIRNYKNAADYREAEQAELADIIENACVAIDAATDTAAISVIRSATIALINEIKTDAQLTAEEKAAADQAAADEVAALIDAIGEVEYTDESKGKIDAARAAYDALTDDQKALVENDDVLTAAEAKYDELKAAAETPDDPEEPATPTEPATPADEDDGVCPFCGERHDSRTFMGWIIEYFHDIFFILQKLFFLR